MALTNSQYDTIMRGYDRRQYENYRRQCARTDEIYEKFPRIREIQEAMVCLQHPPGGTTF